MNFQLPSFQFAFANARMGFPVMAPRKRLKPPSSFSPWILETCLRFQIFLHSHHLHDVVMGGQFMVAPWLVKAMQRYNNDSFANKDAYTAQVHMLRRVLQSILHWAFQSLPDEILVGIEVDHNKPHVLEVEQKYLSEQPRFNLFLLAKVSRLRKRRWSIVATHILFITYLKNGLMKSLEPKEDLVGRFTHWLHTSKLCCNT